MLRKTLITLTAIAALSVGSAAMAHGPGGGTSVAAAVVSAAVVTSVLQVVAVGVVVPLCVERWDP